MLMKKWKKEIIMKTKLIPKHQNASGPLILENDNTQVVQPVLPIPATNIDWVTVANNKIDKSIQEQPHSEVVRHPKRPKTEKEAITIMFDPRKAPQTSTTQVIGMSPVDPVGEFVVGNAVLGTPIKLLGKGLLYGAGRVGNNWARAKIISNTLNNSKITPILNFNNAENSLWYRNLLDKGIDPNKALTYLTTKQFEQEFLGKKTFTEVLNLNKQLKNVLNTHKAITWNGNAKLTGSPAISVEGTIKRPTIIPHDLDYYVSPSITESPIWTDLSRTFGKIDITTSPKVPRSLRFLRKRPKENQFVITSMKNTTPDGEIAHTVMGKLNGIPIDFFFKPTMVESGLIKEVVPAKYPMFYKQAWKRWKDLKDIKEFKPYGTDNPILQNKSLLRFNNTILSPEGYPNIEIIEGTPVVMRWDGTFIQLPKELLINK